jgi:hypothetical protein
MHEARGDRVFREVVERYPAADPWGYSFVLLECNHKRRVPLSAIGDKRFDCTRCYWKKREKEETYHANS